MHKTYQCKKGRINNLKSLTHELFFIKSEFLKGKKVFFIFIF